MTPVFLGKIASLNDAFRIAGPAASIVGEFADGGGKWMLTNGVTSLGWEFVTAVVAVVRAFDQFGPRNDPHGEHDFGAFAHAGKSLFWKIDYYDRTLAGGSPDPGDPALTCRVMTIMLTSEY